MLSDWPAGAVHLHCLGPAGEGEHSTQLLVLPWVTLLGLMNAAKCITISCALLRQRKTSCSAERKTSCRHYLSCSKRTHSLSGLVDNAWPAKASTSRAASLHSIGLLLAGFRIRESRSKMATLTGRRTHRERFLSMQEFQGCRVE